MLGARPHLVWVQGLWRNRGLLRCLDSMCMGSLIDSDSQRFWRICRRWHSACCAASGVFGGGVAHSTQHISAERESQAHRPHSRAEFRCRVGLVFGVFKLVFVGRLCKMVPLGWE
eukprot:jgi/Ulvmu1/3640/UM017_0054.1